MLSTCSICDVVCRIINMLYLIMNMIILLNETATKIAKITGKHNLQTQFTAYKKINLMRFRLSFFYKKIQFMFEAEI